MTCDLSRESSEDKGRAKKAPPEQGAKIKLIDKDINHPNRIVFADPVFQSIRKQRALRALYTFNETLHHELSPISWRDSTRPHVFTQPGPKADIEALPIGWL